MDKVPRMPLPERLIIRPPSEAGSLLLRVVRGCHWNRCKFCGIYDLYGQPFEVRELDDVLEDIDLMQPFWGDAPRTAFLGDADPLERPVDYLLPILFRLREKFPSLERVTAYARASSLNRKSLDELNALAGAGLDRVHVGLESGSDSVLKFHRKGASQTMLIQAGQKVRQAGIELSYYVLLGLGGTEHWEDHIEGSAAVINETGPEFVRVRRLWVHPFSPLMREIQAENFREQTPEGYVLELRRLVEQIEADGVYLACDHANNYLVLNGELQKDKVSLLREVDAFLSQPEAVRERHYRSVSSVI